MMQKICQLREKNENDMLAETAAKEFSEAERPEGFSQNVSVAKRGGKVSGDARNTIEKGTSKANHQSDF